MTDVNELASFRPEPPAPKKRGWLWPVIAGSALILGIVIGGASGNADAPAEEVAAQPVPTVTKTVSETDVQEVTPEVCLDALDYADEGFGIASQAMYAAQDVVEALLSEDLSGMEQANSDLQEAAETLNPLADKYNAAKADCRTAAK